MSKEEREKYLEKVCSSEKHNNKLACDSLQKRKSEYPGHSAAGWGIIDELKEFIQAYPDKINERLGGKGGWTPLHYAANYNRVDAIKILLENGADPKVTADFGWTPLHFVKDVKGVKLLCDAGADPNAKTIDDRTTISDIMIRGQGGIQYYEKIKALVAECNVSPSLICNSYNTQIGLKFWQEGLCGEVVVEDIII